MPAEDAAAEFAALAAAALRSGPLSDHVEITTAEGKELLFYGPGPEHAGGGLLLIPAALLDEGGR